MSDLISREDAIKAVTIAVLADKDEIEALEALPSADAEPSLKAIKRQIDEHWYLDPPSAEATIGDYPNDLISRSALMEYCSNQKSKSIDNNDISRFPSAEAVQGEWIDIDNYYRMATCSRCHKVTMFEKWGEYTKPYDFCPNCGARMKGGAE